MWTPYGIKLPKIAPLAKEDTKPLKKKSTSTKKSTKKEAKK